MLLIVVVLVLCCWRPRERWLAVVNSTNNASGVHILKEPRRVFYPLSAVTWRKPDAMFCVRV